MRLALGTAFGSSRGEKDADAQRATSPRLAAADRAVVVAIDGRTGDADSSGRTIRKINGTLAVGARVTIRYTTLSDGQNLAHQISVSKSDFGEPDEKREPPVLSW